MSVEEAINLWELENSGKEEMSEPASAPLLRWEAAQGVSSGASPILGSTTGVPCTSSMVLAAGQQAGRSAFGKQVKVPHAAGVTEVAAFRLLQSPRT